MPHKNKSTINIKIIYDAKHKQNFSAGKRGRRTEGQGWWCALAGFSQPRKTVRFTHLNMINNVMYIR